MIGLLLGAIAGFFGGVSDTLIMRITDIFLAIPYIVLAVAIASIMGKGVNTVIIVLGLTGWLGICRIVRSSFLSLKQLEYVEASHALGYSRWRIMFRHILPNALQPIIVYGTIAVGGVILAEAALSFLGVGPVYPTPAWGLMVSEGKSVISVAPAHAVLPGSGDLPHRPGLRVRRRRPPRRPGPEAEVTLSTPGSRELLLSVRDLHAKFTTDDGVVRAVDGVSFDVHRGEVFSIVGESGSGKSVTAMTILGLLPTIEVDEGQILWKARDLLTVSEEERRKIRGGEIAMIFQDPLTALNPVHTIGRQIGEMARIHEGLSKKDAEKRAVEMLDLVGIPEAAKRASMYPHEFSGGMRQRAMIAMAITCNPDLLIADEPTTALDVTVQAQVLEVLIDIKDEIDSAIILITHDLGVVAGLADQVMVMYAGRQVEMGTTDGDLLRVAPPVHPRPAGEPPAPRRRRRRAAPADHGVAAVADPPAAGLRVPPALPLRPGARPLRHRGARAAPRHRRCPPRRRATTPRRSRASPSTRCAPRPTRPSSSRRRSSRSDRRSSRVERRRDRSRASTRSTPPDARRGGPLLRGDRPGQGLPDPRRRARPHRRLRVGGRRGVARRSSGARPSAWSASRAAASPPPGGCCST